jgi:uncharacterized protein YjbJ (UPF0337 family)
VGRTFDQALPLASSLLLTEPREDCRVPTEDHMSNRSNRSEGAAEELGGKIKKGIGKLIGNQRMEAEGEAKAAKGAARQEAAKSAERTKGKVEETVGAVKNRIGAVIDNQQMQAEGKAKELKGQARQKLNR